MTNQISARIALEIPSISRDRAVRAMARDEDGLAFATCCCGNPDMSQDQLSWPGGPALGGVTDVLRNRGMDDGAVVRLLTSLHLAGHTAPAAALSWALVELARNPHEQERAAAAAAGWDGIGAAPDVLGHVIDETLRLGRQTGSRTGGRASAHRADHGRSRPGPGFCSRSG